MSQACRFRKRQPRFRRLSQWLDWQAQLHPSAIDLGLERCARVAARLGIERPEARLLSVAGTNGKGSCVTYLESMLRAGGLRVGSYLSPHLLRYNERIRIDGVEIDDQTLVSAFADVDAARDDTSLTEFEFGTLAAMRVFTAKALDVLVLEVGLGGRLDAVNVFDADVAVLTSIDIDHVQWLGADREQIGFEKAGIARPQKPLVIGDREPPASTLVEAARLQAPVSVLGRDFHGEQAEAGWCYRDTEGELTELPMPALQGSHQLDNAATAIRAARLIHPGLTSSSISEGLGSARLPGRMQVVGVEPEIIVDVAHNPDSTRALAAALKKWPCGGRTLALLAMYADKDVAAAVAPLATQVHEWHVAGIEGERGMTAAQTRQRLPSSQTESQIHTHETVVDAFAAARGRLGEADRLVVFGSFETVRQVLRVAS